MWKPRLITRFWDAYDWAFCSLFHITLHPHKNSYHVIGSDRDRLLEFGRLMGASSRMLSVIDSPGHRVFKGRDLWHFDDWRWGKEDIYLPFL